MHLADEETIRPQSTARTGCGATDCAAHPWLLRRLVAAQLLALRALVASPLVRFADLAVPANWDLILSAGDPDPLCASSQLLRAQSQVTWSKLKDQS